MRPLLAMMPLSIAAAAALVWLLPAPAVPASETAAATTPAPPVAPPPLRAAFARPLFGQAAEVPPEDAPDLVGVVGRLGRDAVALVRGADGATRTLAPGAAIDGWQLRELAIDAAYFTRGGQSVRVPMPTQ